MRGTFIAATANRSGTRYRSSTDSIRHGRSNNDLMKSRDYVAPKTVFGNLAERPWQIYSLFARFDSPVECVLRHAIIRLRMRMRADHHAI